MEFSDAYDQRKDAIELKETIETVAAAAVAEANLERGAPIYKSYDATDRDALDASQAQADKPSFMRMNPDDYGISVASKWALGQSPRKGGSDDDFKPSRDRDVKSEVDATEKQVKRSNLIDMFLRGSAVDRYIVENLYGKERYLSATNPDQTVGETSMLEALNVDETFAHQMQLLHKRSYYGIAHSGDGGKRKLSAFETYVALIKGYCALMILVLPKSFTTGGYVFSPLCLLASATLQVFAGLKLVQTAQSLGLTSYGLIALKVLGPNAK